MACGPRLLPNGPRIFSSAVRPWWSTGTGTPDEATPTARLNSLTSVTPVTFCGCSAALWKLIRAGFGVVPDRAAKAAPGCVRPTIPLRLRKSARSLQSRWSTKEAACRPTSLPASTSKRSIPVRVRSKGSGPPSPPSSGWPRTGRSTRPPWCRTGRSTSGTSAASSRARTSRSPSTPTSRTAAATATSSGSARRRPATAAVGEGPGRSPPARRACSAPTGRSPRRRRPGGLDHRRRPRRRGRRRRGPVQTRCPPGRSGRWRSTTG